MRFHIVIEYGKKYTSFKFLLVGPQNTKAPPGMFSGKLLNVLCFQYNSVATQSRSACLISPAIFFSVPTIGKIALKIRNECLLTFYLQQRAQQFQCESTIYNIARARKIFNVFQLSAITRNSSISVRFSVLFLTCVLL